MFGAHRSGYQMILLVLAIYCAGAISITRNPTFFLYDDRPTTFFLVSWALPIVGWYGVVASKLVFGRRPAPLLRLYRYTRLYRAWIGRALLMMVAVALWASAFTILKMNIPHWVPYYADSRLIQFDRDLLGTDAWRLTHAVIGPTGTIFLDRAYGVWFLVLVGFLGWTIASRNTAFQVQSLLTFLLLWLILGIVTATSLASVGPCFLERFSGRSDFAPLMAELRASPKHLWALDAMAYLERMVGKTAYANGISAMPSMHVSLATWFVLVVRAGMPKLLPTLLAVAYAGTVLVGSVHLGWHYAADGLVALVFTPLVWHGVRLFLAPAVADNENSDREVAACAS